MDKDFEYDFFVSHASEDKAFVAELVHALAAYDLNIWYDDDAIGFGDNLHQAIDTGLLNSRGAILVLSDDFFHKRWVQQEVAAALQLRSDPRRTLLTVLHGIDAAGVMNHSPLLAGIRGIDSRHDAGAVARDIHLQLTDGKRAQARRERALVSAGPSAQRTANERLSTAPPEQPQRAAKAL